MVAVYVGNLDAVQVLLDAGAEKNMHYDTGKLYSFHLQTPLDVAIAEGYEEIQKLLIQYGAITSDAQYKARFAIKIAPRWDAEFQKKQKLENQ